MSNQEIAQTILAQLGGNKFQSMTGAKFSAIENGLAVSFKGSKKANMLSVTLDPSDTYTMKFGKLSGTSFKEVSNHEDVYDDQLVTIFEDVTGLRTKL